MGYRGHFRACQRQLYGAIWDFYIASYMLTSSFVSVNMQRFVVYLLQFPQGKKNRCAPLGRIGIHVPFSVVLPDDAWLHFHCRAGKGRTTSYMAMYDMMRNPQVPCEDIISRQYLLGGAYLAFELQNPQPSQWRAKYYQEKAQMIRKFYQYVQENRQSNFKMKWSKWLKAHRDSLKAAQTAA